MSQQPASQRAEESVIGALLRSEDARMQVIGAGLEPEHFHYRPYRLAFEEVVERFYADDAVDSLSVAEAVGPAAAKAWKLEEREAIDRLTALAQLDPGDEIATAEHVKIIRRHSDYRELLRIASRAVNDAIEQGQSPEEIAGTLGTAATKLITGTMINNELIPYADAGRRWMRGQQEEIAARAAGIEIGATFGIKGVDGFVKGLRPTELMMLGGDPGVGKALALDTPIATPGGWTTMREVETGSTVLGSDGCAARVRGVSAVRYDRECFRVVFNDGSSLVADGDHLWRTQTRKERVRQTSTVKTTREIGATLLLRERPGVSRLNHSVDVTQPLALPAAEQAIDPYVLGCWLGDGRTRGGGFTCVEADLLSQIGECGYAITRTRTEDAWLIVGLGEQLGDLGLSGEKFIPAEYLRGSENQRAALLGGLIDTDGHVDKRGQVEITLTNERLARDAHELAISLGLKATIRANRAKLDGHWVGWRWRIHWRSARSFARLERKQIPGALPVRGVMLKRRYIRSIMKVPSVPVKCIRVERGMFLAGRTMIPTHNSGLVWAMGRGFAHRQMRKPIERRVASLILSLEMGEQQSSSRFAQIESGVDGEKLRTGSLTRMELREIAAKWAANRDLPLVLNHSGELRESQIRAVCVDAIRRFNVGLVIIDHFRFIKTDERYSDKNEADDQIVKFLKSTLAKDLNLAVICLAHTTKGESGRRPVMDDLRGSKMISAFADVVAFLYSPWKHASQSERDRGLIDRYDYEVIFDKLRMSGEGTGIVYMNMSTMTVR